MFQTAMPAAMAAAVVAAFDVMEEEPQRREYVRETSKRVRDTLESLGFDTFGSETQIVPIGFGTQENAARAAAELREAGILAPPYYFPAVGKDEAMVRVNINYLHQPEDISHMLERMGRVGTELSVIGA
jgi:7-keto-8-aminopelargonate synthetase-like enzyme